MIVVLCHEKLCLYILNTIFSRFFYCVQEQSVIYYNMSGKHFPIGGQRKLPID